MFQAIIQRLKKQLPYFIDPSKPAELIVLCPARARPCGGVKVLYRQTELLHQLLSHDSISAKIMHPKNLAFKCTWFKHKAPIKHNAAMSPHDIVIIPETMVSKHAPVLHRLGIRYCIYVQNGYLISNGNLAELNTYYAHATLIMAISEDAVNCIKAIFPNLDAHKISRIHYSIDTQQFKPGQSKTNTITYMPRKLAKHAKLVEDFLKNSLPSHWQLVPIQNKSEADTAALLAASKIFLSFSEFEGCPLPPAEAALCGNYVVGYTGEGAREYFHLPAFSEISMGDIKHFCSEILRRIQQCDNSSHDASADIGFTIDAVSSTYSAQMELHDLKTTIGKLMPAATML
ncbi:hypothetical protein LG200_02590 [Methylobacillus caricis]|uniref:hypothetical protein n=1 Tax=Methylobacillus caricis TaxID=1971611 RepID=UPI001CFF6917|nr:hypothetical protein [Methylobacillus caricis]MCB5186890.1 hypothetical protein [Methylobacillus caricis]